MESNSLIPSGEQQDLFALPVDLGAEVLEVQRRWKVGEYNGQRACKDLERYKGIIADYAANVPVRVICRRWHLSHHTLQAIVDREPELIATEKNRASRKLGRIINIMADRLEFEAQNIPIGSVPLAMAVLIDKKQVYDGEPTQIVSTRKELSADAVNRWIDSLPEAKRPVLEVGSTDSESNGKATNQAGNTENPAEWCNPGVNPTEKGRIDAGGDEAGGGGVASTGPVPATNSLSREKF
jgi:hypothetical protein